MARKSYQHLYDYGMAEAKKPASDCHKCPGVAATAKIDVHAGAPYFESFNLCSICFDFLDSWLKKDPCQRLCDWLNERDSRTKDIWDLM